MLARTIGTLNGAAEPRTIDSVTVVSFAPRIFCVVWSVVRPSTLTPSIAAITSPGWSPARSAGEPGMVDSTASRQVADSGVHVVFTPFSSTVPTVVPMPERAYPASVKLFESTWKRPRWFASRMVRAEVKIEKGIPFPGKGENSYDCGDDALFGLTCKADTVEQAIAETVESALRNRRRYGGSVDWQPAAEGA